MEEWDPLKDEEMNEYFNKQRLIDSQISYAELKGIEQGESQAKQEDAINLIKENISLDVISRCTGLSIAELEKLRNGIMDNN